MTALRESVRRLSTGALAAGIAIGLAAGLVACGETAPTFDLAGAREATLTVIVAESVSFRDFQPSKEVRFGVRGVPEASADGGVRIAGELLWLELTYVGNDGDASTFATDGTREDPTVEALPLARRAVLEALLGRPVRIEFDAEGAITAFEGLGDALGTAVREAGAADGVDADMVAAAAPGMAQLLDDARVLRGLSAAGVCAAPPEVLRRRGSVSREVDVLVAGRGVTRVTTVGQAGETPAGEASVAFEGRLATDAAFTGDGGAEPPASIGPVDIGGVRVEVSTEYAGVDLRPLRGHVGVELPHAAGPLVRRRVDFILLVDG